MTTLDEKAARTIVALDVSSRSEAMSLVESLAGLPGMFKVGLQLFLGEGPDIVRAIVDRGERVFLDLKLHDIPNTVARAAAEAAKLGVSMLTIHGSGGEEMIRATSEHLEDRFGEDRPIVAVVTVLTSMDNRGLERTGVVGTAGEQVLRLAEMGRQAGADGVICSPDEVGPLRARLGQTVKLVTPGVRMPGQSADDQKRIATPAEALARGADWLVIGRYVNRSPNPREALLEVVASLASS
jgi:orotidine-5'-phosphate decarboxylase